MAVTGDHVMRRDVTRTAESEHDTFLQTVHRRLAREGVT